MPGSGIKISLHEKDSYDYVYVDEDNKVHLLCPVVGGETVGIDNTCKATEEMQTFFVGDSFFVGSQKSAIDVLKKYRSDLEHDIGLLEIAPDYRAQQELKKVRLAQHK